jgi:ATP-dependent Lhr-like helicase
VRTLIVDEIHALVGNRRGSHLALSMERLASLVNGPLQRIGLSATQKPIEEAATFLLGTSGLDEQGCAVASTSNGPAFNPVCPIVQRHLCAASAESIQVNLQLGRRDQAERLKETAVSQLRCPSEPIERLLPTGR